MVGDSASQHHFLERHTDFYPNTSHRECVEHPQNIPGTLDLYRGIYAAVGFLFVNSDLSAFFHRWRCSSIWLHFSGTSLKTLPLSSTQERFLKKEPQYKMNNIFITHDKKQSKIIIVSWLLLNRLPSSKIFAIQCKVVLIVMILNCCQNV